MVSNRQLGLALTIPVACLGMLAACGAPIVDPSDPGTDPTVSTGSQSAGTPFHPTPQMPKPVAESTAFAQLIPPVKQTGPREPSGDWPAIQTSVPLYELTVSQANLKALDDNIDNDKFEVPGTFTFDGRTWNVTVSYRGQSTRYLPKKSFAVKFPDTDKFVDGSKRLDLLAEWKDGGLLTEKLWWDLAAAAGVRVPDTSYVRLNLNGSFYGVELRIESIRKPFLKAHQFDSNSDIYRAGQFDGELRDPPQEFYQLPWERETNDSQPFDNLWAFLKSVNRTAPDDFKDYVQKNFEVHEYLQWLAVDALISNDTIEDARIYLVWDPTAKRWAYVPWDLNNALSLMNRESGWPNWPNAVRPLMDFSAYDAGVWDIFDWRQTDPWFGGKLKPAWSTLNTRMLDDAEWRQELYDRTQALLSSRFTVSAIGDRAEKLHALIAPYLAQDPWVDQTMAAASVQYMKDYVSQRRQFVQDHLWQVKEHGTKPTVVIQSVSVDANGTPSFELYNQASSSKSVGGMKLTGELRTPEEATLAAQSVPSNESISLTAPSGLIFDKNKVEIGLYESDARTPIDLIFLPPMKPGEKWARVPAGSETWKKVAP